MQPATLQLLLIFYLLALFFCLSVTFADSVFFLSFLISSPKLVMLYALIKCFNFMVVSSLVAIGFPLFWPDRYLILITYWFTA